MTMPRRRPATPALGLKGSLTLAMGDQDLAGAVRMGLLQAVAEQGSITQAAKAYGMSYKAAWDAIDAMNTLSGTPLVERVTGGRGGGRTRLTDHGQRLLERYGQIQAVHQRFLDLLDLRALDLAQDFSILQALNMKTSARNQWVGSIAAIRAGAVNDEVELDLAGGQRLSVIVTRESTEALALRLKQTVIALVKSSSVMLATGLSSGPARVSTRNHLHGSVRTIRPGAVNAEVIVDAGGLAIVAIVDQHAIADLGLQPGSAVSALVKPSDVILATVA
ncbi:TOBE domain-containing protein [Sphaerotilus mobilis]|uniref:Molybdate transport system regulatory protein n=1 Tax=Sphaerotilus mobilis TaxID=47994 RepID=A0A4Q7LT38_9BURK|nr:TOBE domain-containing protein [Sphaerotilus mobilis]RZS56899.1 molybdate transport system regulatory protein [Sphaerotilus mobilis]